MIVLLKKNKIKRSQITDIIFLIPDTHTDLIKGLHYVVKKKK